MSTVPLWARTPATAAFSCPSSNEREWGFSPSRLASGAIASSGRLLFEPTLFPALLLLAVRLAVALTGFEASVSGPPDWRSARHHWQGRTAPPARQACQNVVHTVPICTTLHNSWKGIAAWGNTKPLASFCANSAGEKFQ